MTICTLAASALKEGLDKSGELQVPYKFPWRGAQKKHLFPSGINP